MKNKLISLYNSLNADKKPRDIIAGFDGFIDEIIHVVNTRSSKKEYTRLEKINSFAERIYSAAGLSTNMEFVPQLTKIGGNGVIMANALVETGMNIDYFGSLGYPEIDPLFSEFAGECRSVISLCDPGHTDALEFDDGKLLMGKLTSLNNLNWENIVKHTGIEKLQRLTADADLIAFTNWTMLFEMNSILCGFRDMLKQIKSEPLIFIDLADPAKRKEKDILEVLHLLTSFSDCSRLILGMNEKESALIAKCLEIDEPDIAGRAAIIREKLDLYCVVIHPVKGAAAANKIAKCWVDGPYTSKPVLTTGAGDNFNAGFCLGMLLGMSLEDALYCGVHTSGYYVRQAKSPKRAELLKFIREQ